MDSPDCEGEIEREEESNVLNKDLEEDDGEWKSQQIGNSHPELHSKKSNCYEKDNSLEVGKWNKEKK